MRLTIIILILMSCFCDLIAQDMVPDTILNLKDVNVYSSRINRFAKGQEVFALDSLTRSAYPASTLAELINGSTSAYIKSYGQGTLSTLSFRGTSANHAALFWNGILLAPPNIGYVDLSLVQGNYFNEISILYGGASPMFGSGSIGGGIHLENRPVFEKSGFKAGLNISAGSFGMMAVEANGTVFRKNIFSRTAFNFNKSSNDFPYNNLNGEKDTLPHAEILKSGFIQDVAFQLPGNQYLMASIWFQYADRDIPPTLTVEKSEAVQLDRSWRSMILWKNFNDRNTLEARIAYFNEYTSYVDPSAEVYSTILSQALIGSFESSWDIGKNSALFLGSQITYEYADLVNYEQPQDKVKLAVYGSYSYNFQSIQWQASVNCRQEFFTQYQSPFLFSAGMEGKIWRFISGRLNFSRNFRVPTFNERFWQPGGNPELEPEESWNEEAGISIEHQISSSIIKFSFTAFNSNVDKWILWLPGTSYWSVENAQEVWCRGIEISGKQTVPHGNITLFMVESYSYTRSTNQKKLFDLDASYKKQLIYSPVHRFIIKSGVLYKGFNMTLNGNFTGEVFTTKDNTEALPPFFIMDAVASQSFKIKNQYPLTIQLNMNNILNKDYQSVPYRPMPGINFLVTVKAEISRQ